VQRVSAEPCMSDIAPRDLEDDDDFADLDVELHLAVGFGNFGEAKCLVENGLAPVPTAWTIPAAS
jgi:hypothetical protein